MRRAALFLAVLAVGLPAANAAAAATAPKPRTSLSDLETEVMCVLCKVPLQVAGDAPQAVAERQFIKGLIAQGQTKAQIKDALVAQYGPAVLANPPTSGFSLSAYVIPIVAVVAAVALLALMLPRWRRRSRAPAPAAAAFGPELDPADARRLDEDLARFDR
jgi:cytochrome c-type biogenesis protein CcmH